MLNKEQLLKIDKVLIITTFVLLVFEIIFSFNAVTNFFESIILNSNGILVYVVIWIIMFLQVTILNIPAYVILSTSVAIGINTLSFTYIVVVLSAYMVGCCLAYWIGRKFGSKAIKWCAGSETDYNKWSEVLNKKGKWWYFATVIFPVFPDDLLCLVAGAMKFNFGYYFVFNLIGRGVGLITMLYALQLISFGSSSFPFMIIVWGLALILEIVLYFVLKRRKRMNLIVIGNNTDNICMDIWKANTNYTILNKNPDVFSKEFNKYIKNKQVIISTTSEQFENKPVNSLLDFLESKEFIPIFIAESEDCLEMKMYYAIYDIIQTAVLFMRNEENADYDELIKIAQGYVLGKGIDDDNTIQTSRGREEETSGE